MNHKTTKNNHGFTLVETLVAIAVLMIAVAGPLSIANRALTSALYSRDQSIASNLAQESMEIIKNIRDNNIKNNAVSFLEGLCVPGNNICDAGFSAGGDPESSICPSPDGCRIYINPYNGYHHTEGSGDDIASLFSRYFFLTKIDDDDYQVTVVVKWNEMKTPNEIRLRSELVNATRQ